MIKKINKNATKAILHFKYKKYETDSNDETVMFKVIVKDKYSDKEIKKKIYNHSNCKDENDWIEVTLDLAAMIDGENFQIYFEIDQNLTIYDEKTCMTSFEIDDVAILTDYIPPIPSYYRSPFIRFIYGPIAGVTFSWSIDHGKREVSTQKDEIIAYKIYKDSTLIEQTTNTSFIASGIEDSTSYEYSVSAVYDDNYETLLEKCTFRGSFVNSSSLPFMQNFNNLALEGGRYLPLGWNVIKYGWNSGTWMVTRIDSISSSQSTDKQLLFNVTNACSGDSSILITRALKMNDIYNPSLAFDFYHTDNNPDSLDRLSLYADIGEDDLIQLENPIFRYSSTPGWQHYQYDLSEFVNSDYLKIGFMGHAEGGSNILLDNIAISGFQIQTPSNISISILDDTVQLRWDPVEDVEVYKVYSSYNPDGDFQLDLSGDFDQTSWIAPKSDRDKFYFISAVKSKQKEKDVRKNR